MKRIPKKLTPGMVFTAESRYEYRVLATHDNDVWLLSDNRDTACNSAALIYRVRNVLAWPGLELKSGSVYVRSRWVRSNGIDEVIALTDKGVMLWYEPSRLSFVLPIDRVACMTQLPDDVTTIVEDEPKPEGEHMTTWITTNETNT